MSPDWLIELLDHRHRREAFDCGESALNDYLRRYARQHAEAGLSRSFVAVPVAGSTDVLGYYSLSMGSLARANLPLAAQRRLPNFPIPVARLARLAVARSAQGHGVGEGLLMDALVRCHALSRVIGLVAVVVDAKHERARAFYRRYAFEELPDQPLTLWLPMKSLRNLLRGCH